MHRRTFLLALTTLAASGMPAYAGDSWYKKLMSKIAKQRQNTSPGTDTQSRRGLSALDADRGLRQALDIGIDAVVAQLGAPGGFLDDAIIRIVLPKPLRKARKLAKPLGMAGPFDNLVTRMNHGAEAAMPKGKALLKHAVHSMSVEDAIAIVRGPDDSATQYLRKTMEPSLATAFTPVIRSTLGQSGALNAGRNLADRYSLGSYADSAGDKLTKHVVKGALKGSFYYLAEQEREIRAHPGRFASELLKRVFG